MAHKLIADDANLKESYGEEIPQPSMSKGTSVVFGELAGSTSSAKPLIPKRNICMDDSIK